MAAYKTATGKDLALPTSAADYVAISKFMKASGGLPCGDAGPAWDPTAWSSRISLLAGGAYLDKIQGGLNSPAGLKALELYVDNIKNGAQQGALSATLDDTYRLMCDGKAFSMVTYWWMLPQLTIRRNVRTLPARSRSR